MKTVHVQAHDQLIHLVQSNGMIAYALAVASLMVLSYFISRRF